MDMILTETQVELVGCKFYLQISKSDLRLDNVIKALGKDKKKVFKTENCLFQGLPWSETANEIFSLQAL